MKYYVRKITLSKFPKPPAISYEISSLRADAVADIRTFKDSLSVWEIESDSADAIDEAILALVTSSKQENFDKIDVVVFSEDDVLSNGLSLEKDDEREDGDTAVSDLRNTHQNIVGLTYESLSIVLKIISDITIRGQRTRRTGKQVEALIKNNFTRINLDSFISDDIKTTIKRLAGVTV